MFQLDDKFLQDIGLGELPEEQKKAFLQHIYSELELRVGTKLSDGMTDDQLQEFEQIIDRNEEAVDAWLAQHAPNYAQEEAFQRLATATKLEPTNIALKAEYTATKWLELNRPDYRDVVARTLDELKQEITANKEAILEGATGQAPAPEQPIEHQPSTDQPPGQQPPAV